MQLPKIGLKSHCEAGARTFRCKYLSTTTCEILTKFCSGRLEKPSTKKNSFFPYISIDHALECRVVQSYDVIVCNLLCVLDTHVRPPTTRCK